MEPDNAENSLQCKQDLRLHHVVRQAVVHFVKLIKAEPEHVPNPTLSGFPLGPILCPTGPFGPICEVVRGVVFIPAAVYLARPL
eukprot:1195450-Prorocentrum_minimum.AAC.9